jgi:hypothetical protein
MQFQDDQLNLGMAGNLHRNKRTTTRRDDIPVRQQGAEKGDKPRLFYYS